MESLFSNLFMFKFVSTYSCWDPRHFFHCELHLGFLLLICLQLFCDISDLFVKRFFCCCVFLFFFLWIHMWMRLSIICDLICEIFRGMFLCESCFAFFWILFVKSVVVFILLCLCFFKLSCEIRCGNCCGIFCGFTCVFFPNLFWIVLIKRLRNLHVDSSRDLLRQALWNFLRNVCGNIFARSFWKKKMWCVFEYCCVFFLLWELLQTLFAKSRVLCVGNCFYCFRNFRGDFSVCDFVLIVLRINFTMCFVKFVCETLLRNSFVNMLVNLFAKSVVHLCVDVLWAHPWICLWMKCSCESPAFVLLKRSSRKKWLCVYHIHCRINKKTNEYKLNHIAVWFCFILYNRKSITKSCKWKISLHFLLICCFGFKKCCQCER